MAAHLTCVKEDYIPVLRQLAAAGYLAISLDRWRHGERGSRAAVWRPPFLRGDGAERAIHVAA